MHGIIYCSVEYLTVVWEVKLYQVESFTAVLNSIQTEEILSNNRIRVRLTLTHFHVVCRSHLDNHGSHVQARCRAEFSDPHSLKML